MFKNFCIKKTCIFWVWINVKNIKATFFNKDGLFNPKANYKNCVLPYKDRKKNIKKTCNYAKEFYNEKELSFNYLNEDDIICPTELNKNKQISKFGYCPEVTRKIMQMHTI